MEPSPINPEELLRTYDTAILWVTWIFAVSAWLAALSYLVFVYTECLPLLRSASRGNHRLLRDRDGQSWRDEPASTAFVALRETRKGAQKRDSLSSQLVWRWRWPAA